MMSTGPNTETNLIDSQADWFEAQVLAACCRSAKFYDRFKDIICVSDNPREVENDFSYPCDNIIYKIIGSYRASMAGHAGMDAVHPDFMHVSLRAMAQSGDMLPEQVEQAVQRVQFLATQPCESVLPILEQGVGYWVSKNRARKAAAQAAADLRWTPDELLQKISRIARVGHAAAGENYEHLFGDGWERGEPVVERISSGIARLDRVMGGGFGMKEMTLMIGSTGAGKTVFACQLASTFARNGSPGILATTEETHVQLEPRIVSNVCQIPFDQIKDGIQLDKLSREKADLVRDLRVQIGKKLVILDWINDRSKTVTEDLANEVQKFRETYGCPARWMIFDWLGGALGHLENKDLAVMRLIMARTADKLADIAYQENMVVIALAQGNILQCRNNMRVDSACLAENKSLGRKATTILGISQLQEQVDAMSNGEPPFARKQFIYVSKARKGVGGLIPIHRAFEFQRFENVS